MVVNDDEGSLNERGVLRFFASMLAPTGGCPLPALQEAAQGEDGRDA
jgi:hypothetical protein